MLDVCLPRWLSLLLNFFVLCNQTDYLDTAFIATHEQNSRFQDVASVQDIVHHGIERGLPEYMSPGTVVNLFVTIAYAFV